MSRRLSNNTGDQSQFGLIDLFAIVTIAALLSAMAAPIIRGMHPGNRGRLVVLTVIQLLITAGAFAFVAHQRKELLQRSGSKIGVA